MAGRELIITAIRENRVLDFYYNGGKRKIEPYLLGHTAATERLVVVGYQIGGYSESKAFPPWRCFEITRIRTLKAGSVFNNERKKPDPGDFGIKRVLLGIE